MGWQDAPIVEETAPQWQSAPAMADQDGMVPEQARTKLTPDNWLQSAANDIQAKQEQRVRHNIDPMNADEQMKLQDRYRVAAGMEPIYKRALQRYQEMRQARTTDSDWQNYLNNIANTTGSFMAGMTEVGYKLSDLVGATKGQSAKFARQQARMTESLAPRGGVSGFGGRFTGNFFNMLLLGGGAKTKAGTPFGGRMLAQLPTAGAFGVSSAGSAITDIEQRRAKGEEVSGGQMFAAATLNAIIETGIEMFGLEMVSMAGRALGREVPSIVNALRKGSATGAGRALVKAIVSKQTIAGLAKASAGGTAEEVTTQIGQNLVNKYVAGVQDQAIMEGVGEAALQGGLMPLFAGGISAIGRGTKAGPTAAPTLDTGLKPGDTGPAVEGTEHYPIPPLVKYEGGGPLATIPRKTPIIPRDSGKTYSQAGPGAPLIVPPTAGQVTPEQTLEMIREIGPQVPSPPPTPGAAFPIVPSGGPLVSQQQTPVIPVDRGKTYSQPGPDAPQTIVPMPSAGQITPEQTLEEVAIAGRQVDEAAPAQPQPSLADRIVSDETGAIPLSAMSGASMKAVAPIAHLVNDAMGEMAMAVADSPDGKAVVRSLDSVSTKAATLLGRIANVAADAYTALSRLDLKWLHTSDVNGYSNMQRLVEDTPSGRLTAPNSQIQGIVDAYNLMIDVTGQEAERLNVQVITPDGEVIYFKQASTGRYLRNMTPDAFVAITQGSGPLFDAIAAAVARDNNVDMAKAGLFLREWLGPESVRKVGQIERLRAIKFMPTTVKVNGKSVSIQETDPYLAIMNNARRQAKRIYFIGEFEQNIKGKPTRLELLRASFQKSGGKVADFDDMITVFEERPYKRVFRDPRALLSRAIRIVDSIIATAQTSLSAIPNLPQTLILVPKYVGVVNYLKALGHSLRHPRLTTAQLAGIGAMNRSVLDWTLRPGHGPEDFVKIFKGVVARVTGLEAISQFNNQVSGVGFSRLADSWLQNGIESKDIAVARDLRLTKAEISAINAGKMTQGIYNKIVQNGVKITQFITEDPHRMSKWQHIPMINGLIAYNNYAIGTAKAVMRIGRETALAVQSGDSKQRIAAAKRIVMFLAGATGAGTVSLLLRRAVKGQEVLRPDEDPEDILLKALWEAAILGPTQRMQDAFDYSGGSTEKAMVGISPKLSAVASVLSALRGYGRWGELPPAERAGKVAVKNAPLVRAVNSWWEHAMYPQVELYKKTRSLASAYRPKDSVVTNVPINPYYYHVHQAIIREDAETLDTALDQFQVWAAEQKWSPEESRRRLRGALMARRPVAFDLATYREFVASLSPEKRHMVTLAQAQYTEAIDFLTLTSEETAARKGDLDPLRKKVESGRMGRGKARQIIGDARKTDLQRKFRSTNFVGAMRVWATASPEERADLRAQLLEKARTAIRTRPIDQQKILDELQKAGVTE